MPRHDVGMVLHHGEHDLVARLDQRREIGVAHEVDRLGAAAREDDLVRVAGVEELLHADARFFVALGRRAREIVHAAVHIRIFAGGEIVHGIQHVVRLLRRGRVVEIDELLAVHLAREDREVVAQSGDIIRASLYARFDVHVSARSIALSATSNRCHSAPWTAGSTKSPIASSRNAWVNSSFASDSGTPRERR